MTVSVNYRLQMSHRSTSTLRIVELCIDANDQRRLAGFWAAALRWEIDVDTYDDIGLVPTDNTRFKILFEPTRQTKVGKNRIHLDLTTESVDDQNDTVATLLELGARHIDIGQSANESHVVLADPEGNEFCVLAPNNTFLAGCERLGAINCDGRRETGYFWSAALGWPVVWDQNGETAIRAPDNTGPLITWSGPPLIPKLTKNRLHLDIAPAAEQGAEVERLLDLGATRVDIGQGHLDWLVMADPDENEFCLLQPSAKTRESEMISIWISS